MFGAVLLCLILSSTGVLTIPLEDFYPFGFDAVNNTLGRIDDGGSVITLSRPFPFFRRQHFIIFVSNNGHISFTDFGGFRPVPFPISLELIAPFWADVDTSPQDGGTVWYRESRDQADLDRAQQEIRTVFPDNAGSFTARLVFIATWDHVGYYRGNTDKTNTFQCILVTDGIMSFTIFLYADGLIQWTTGDTAFGSGGLGGIPAHVGYNSEFGESFTTHEYSFTANVLNMTSSRVPEDTVPVDGMVVYRIDSQETGTCAVDGDDAELYLSPLIGNLLGGMPLLIRGLCFEPDDAVSCTIDNRRTTGGRILNRYTALCTTPVMNTLGNVDIQVRRIGSSRTVAQATFVTVSPIRAHQVGFSIDTADNETQLYFRPNDVVRLTWSPSEVVPSYLNPYDFTVNIQLFQQVDVTSSTSSDPSWIPIPETLIGGLENTGSYNYTIIDGLTLSKCAGQTELCPVAFQITAVKGTVVNVTDGEEVELPTAAGSLRVGIWSGVGYLQPNPDAQADLNEICNNWASSTSPNNEIPESRQRQLLACPPMESQASLDTRYRREEMNSIVGNTGTSYMEEAMKFFYPMAAVCYLQVIMAGSADVEGQQCCYDDNGILVTGQPAGGSIDKTSPLVDFNRHSMNDLLPFAFCCRSGAMTRCAQYDGLRPSNNRDLGPYVLTPPACVFGDPHIVTLDGHKYTFNGKGEFVLVETYDNSFTLQGRMEQPLDMAPGTVFTAIVAHQAGPVPRTVEFQVNEESGDLDILVDGSEVSFVDLLEQDFQQVVVIDQGNNTVVAEFSGGSNVEIRADNNIVSVMLVSLPNQYRSLTSGLMGNYNGDDTDDLTPRFTSSNIPADSSMEDIFEFGNTWIINDPAESFFAYNVPGHSFEIFRDLDFEPAFEPVFDDPELEQRAGEICGNNAFCLFDIAATGNEDIGMSTMQGDMDFDEIVVLAEPIVCEPPCENGVCVATDTCSCSVGFSGVRCAEKIKHECDVNMCQNNGTCVQHVQSFNCECPEGFIGIFCQEKEPPLSVTLINSSPRVSDNAIAMEFLSSKPLASATCSISNVTEVDCSAGYVRFEDIPPGSQGLVITAEAISGEMAVERRTLFLCDSEANSCGANLINEGVVVTGDCARIQFSECGKVDSLRCSLDNGPFTPCLSPTQHCGLELGEHRFQVLPFGEDCGERGRLSVNFDVI